MKGTEVNDFKKYCEGHLLEMISSSVEPVTMKLTKKWMEKTLENLLEVTCTHLKVPGSRLSLNAITKGCVAVHWLCPVSVVPALREAIMAATDALQLEGINQIFIGKEPVMDQPISSQG